VVSGWVGWVGGGGVSRCIAQWSAAARGGSTVGQQEADGAPGAGGPPPPAHLLPNTTTIHTMQLYSICPAPCAYTVPKISHLSTYIRD
jgi:hypothetical protein